MFLIAIKLQNTDLWIHWYSKIMQNYQILLIITYVILEK